MTLLSTASVVTLWSPPIRSLTRLKRVPPVAAAFMDLKADIVPLQEIVCPDDHATGFVAILSGRRVTLPPRSVNMCSCSRDI